MIDAKFLDNLTKQLSNLIPENLHTLREDLEKNIRASLLGVFSKLDLVTREEFDVQTKLLRKAKEDIKALEAKIIALEQSHCP